MKSAKGTFLRAAYLAYQVTTLLVSHALMERDDIWRMDAEAA